MDSMQFLHNAVSTDLFENPSWKQNIYCENKSQMGVRGIELRIKTNFSLKIHNSLCFL